MRQRTPAPKFSREKAVCKFLLYDEGFRHQYSDVSQLIICARTALTDTEDPNEYSGNILVAKASHGTRSVLFLVDEDNYEFVLRMPGGKLHLTGGFLATDFRGVSVHELEQLMKEYLISGKSIAAFAKSKTGNRAV